MAMLQDQSKQEGVRSSYCDFFGFSEKPFELTPDPAFLFMSKACRDTLASLTYGIRDRRGFVCVIGETGVGKTTLLNSLRTRLDERTKVAFLSNTALTFEEMLTLILIELGLSEPGEALSRVEGLRRLKALALEQLSTGGNVVIMVDEAQNLENKTLERIRLLSNLETPKQKLIQIVLSGQPELDSKLQQPELRQLDQRISVKRYLVPLNESETYEYVQDRLVIADYRGPTLFSRKALQLVWEFSGGVPRNINGLCERALMIANGWGKRKIKLAVMEEAVKELSWSPYASTDTAESDNGRAPISRTGGNVRFRYGLVTGLALAFCLFSYLGFTVLREPHEPNLKQKEISVSSGQTDRLESPHVPTAFAGVAEERQEDAAGPPEGKAFSDKNSVKPVLQAHTRGSLTPNAEGNKALGKPKSGGFAVQLGAFREGENAKELVSALQLKGFEAYVEFQETKRFGPLFRVRVRGYATKDDASRAITLLEENGFKGGIVRKE